MIIAHAFLAACWRTLLLLRVRCQVLFNVFSWTCGGFAAKFWTKSGLQHKWLMQSTVSARCCGTVHQPAQLCQDVVLDLTIELSK
jgi:hypothetical protein